MTTSQAPYPEESQSVTVLVLGILSIVVCQVLGPFAWRMGSTELRAISEGRRNPENVGLAQAGRICGIIGTCILGLVVVFFLVLLVLFLFGMIASVDEVFRNR
jgi:hypothetical protein